MNIVNLNCGNKKRNNLFEIYKYKAGLRLKELKNELEVDKLPDYLYNENRCGIAHGKGRIKEYDYNENVINIARDNYIMKLIARLAIEDKIKSKSKNVT